MSKRKRPQGDGAFAPAPPFNWTPEAERFYLDLMLHGVVTGKRIDGTFKDTFWNYCISEFAQRHDLRTLTKDQLNTKRADWKKRWRIFHTLSNPSGWSVDDDGRLQASDEAWEEQIRREEAVKWFRRNTLRRRDELRDLFYTKSLQSYVTAKGSLEVLRNYPPPSRRRWRI